MRIAAAVLRLIAVIAVSAAGAVVPACTSEAYSATTATPIPTASKLAFELLPAAVTAGATFTPPVVVGVLDAFGSVYTAAADSVMVAIGTNPAGGTLSGTTTVAAVNGFATFANLSIDKAGSYTLTASAARLAGATSGAISVTAAAPSR